jgi:hypothetical protein
MIRFLYIFIGAILLLTGLSLPALAQLGPDSESGSSIDLGSSSTLYNFDGRTGARHSLGSGDLYGFSDGTTTMRLPNGNADLYTGNNSSVTGSTITSGQGTLGDWQNGVSSGSVRS